MIWKCFLRRILEIFYTSEMKIIHKIIAFISLIGLTIFIGSPLVQATGIENGYLYSFGSKFNSCPKNTYHCEKIDERTYVCEWRSEVAHAQSVQFREMPSGWGTPMISYSDFTLENTGIIAPICLWENYRDPDSPSYPFVSIIKIQV